MVEATNFNEDEVHALSVYFEGIGDKKGKEIVIDRVKFKSALGLKESLFINRMFLMFDTGTFFCFFVFVPSILILVLVFFFSSFCFFLEKKKEPDILCRLWQIIPFY